MKIINSENQSGIVSIMVTMIMMIVISLIVLGFAEISLTEQTNSLDNQLSVQAYYAAESGVNQARADLDNMASPLPTKNHCNQPSGYPNLVIPSSQLSQTYNVAYTCVLINPNPSQLIYDIGYSPTIIPITINNGSSSNTLNLTWTQSKGALPGSCSVPLGNFPPQGQWGCPYPVLRIDLIEEGNQISSFSAMENGTATMFFEPESGNSSNTSGSLGSKGTVYAASCSSSTCTASISGLSNSATYYMKVNTIYSANSILTLSSSSGTTFSGAQVTIDSTGKAQDVLRRIKVAVDLTNANVYSIPNGAIVTEDSICKRFEVTPGYFNVQLPNDGSNPLCSVYSYGTPSP